MYEKLCILCILRHPYFFPVYLRFWSIEKKRKKNLQILLGGTKVFDYVLICSKNESVDFN